MILYQAKQSDNTPDAHYCIPFGVEFKDLVPIMAFIGAGQTNPSRLCSTGSAGVAGKHRLPLHITLQRWAQKHEKVRAVTVYVWTRQQRRRSDAVQLTREYEQFSASLPASTHRACSSSSSVTRASSASGFGLFAAMFLWGGGNTLDQLGTRLNNAVDESRCGSCGGSLSRGTAWRKWRHVTKMLTVNTFVFVFVYCSSSFCATYIYNLLQKLMFFF